MKTKVIDGKKLKEEILEKVKRGAALLPFRPVFSDVLVGSDPASVQYVEMKKRNAEEAGFSFHRANFPESVTTDELVKEIKILNKVKHMCGIILQLPLPLHIDTQMALDAIDPELDVDCLGTVMSEKFYRGEEGLAYPTALAAMAILDVLDLDLKNKNIAVLGQGVLVGKPVTALLKFQGLEPKVVTSETQNKEKEKIIKEADIVISGIGKGKYIEGSMIKEGAVIIDAGASESNGSIVGDVDLESVKNVAGYVSPVPGGVGPVTVAMLLQNVLTVAKSLAKDRGDSPPSNI